MSAVSLPLHLLAAASLLPAALALLLRPADRAAGRDAIYWGLLLLGAAGPIGLSVALLEGGWRAGFGISLWVTAAGAITVFAIIAAIEPTARRLILLLAPYLALLGLIATVWAETEQAGPAIGRDARDPWLTLHIVISVAAYSVISLSAIAAFSTILQERALKRRTPSRLTRRLPAAADAEALEHRLLFAAELLLGLGLLTGMGALMAQTGRIFVVDHKTMLTLVAFAAIAGLLWARARLGLRGRKAAHYVLLAYLLITLGFPGVKFVTDVLIR